MDKKEFKLAFQIDKLVIFEVSYYTLGNNRSPHFSTSSSKFVKNKKDYAQCGQSQKELLYGDALKFYEKFDYLHLSDLTDKEYEEIKLYLTILKDKYNYIEKETRNNINFYEIVELSKLPLKKNELEKEMDNFLNNLNLNDRER